MRKQKSTLVIEEKIFNDDFNDIVVRTDHRDLDGIMHDVLIYDHKKPDKSLVNLISSDSAKMYTSADGNHFIMELYNGIQYQEDAKERKKEGGDKYPFTETQFESYVKVMDLSDFYLSDDELGFSRKREDMLNTVQLLSAIDSLKEVRSESINSLVYNYNEIIDLYTDSSYIQKALDQSRKRIAFQRLQFNDSISQKSQLLTYREKINANKEPAKAVRNRNSFVRQFPFSKLDSVTSLYEMFYPEDRPKLINRSVSLMSSRADVGVSVVNKLNGVKRSKNKYLLRLHQHFAHAFICLLFFFIGAPLGSIIRKGGYGYSLLIAISFYMVFRISQLSGERLVGKESMTGIAGAWLPCLILLPFAVVFTQLAMNDKKFDLAGKLSTIIQWIRRD